MSMHLCVFSENCVAAQPLLISVFDDNPSGAALIGSTSIPVGVTSKTWFNLKTNDSTKMAGQVQLSIAMREVMFFYNLLGLLYFVLLVTVI